MFKKLLSKILSRQVTVKEDVTWCCTAFDNSISLNEEAGVGIVPCHNQLGERVFQLTFKLFSVSTLERSLEERRQLYALKDGESMGFPLIVFRPILFCPWCGAELKKFIAHRVARFDEVERNLHPLIRRMRNINEIPSGRVFQDGFYDEARLKYGD